MQGAFFMPKKECDAILKAYYGARISPHMTESPEGFLICHKVPICRIGTQKYLPSEIGEKGEGLVDVYREEDEVFALAAMASFEGKPVTDDHPPREVTPDNYGSYTKGVVQNVRRGTGDAADYVICDLVIYDAGLINKIQHGKREVSCGYDCKYVDNGDGTYHQADIIGNHVAIVDSGRAGKDVSIKDAMPSITTKGRESGMAKNIWERMFGAFVKDAEPAEVLEAAKAVDEACGEKEKTEDRRTCDEDMEMVMKAIHELNEKLEAMKNDLNGHYDEDKEHGEELEEKLSGLDAVEAAIKERMTAKDTDEEEVTVDPETLNDEEPEEIKEEEEAKAEVVESDDEAPEEEEIEEEVKEKVEAKDHAISLAMLRAIKPIVASMPKEQRKLATDALNKAVRKAMDVKSTQPIAGGYGALLKRKKTNDAEVQANLRAFGEACRKRNPHVK